MAYTQENRLIAVNTPLGEDVLLLTGFNGFEAISRLFHFQLEMISEQEALPADDVVGKNATVRVRLADGSDRYFNGYVSRFSQGGRDQHFTYYQAELVPWIWFLTRTSDCRIFQEKSVPEIIEKILKEYQFQNYSLKLYGNYVKRDYCVQYRETDFNFISRLMEEEGIFYFFKHENGKHTLVLADSPSEHQECPKQASARYELTAGGWQDDDVVLEFRLDHEFRPGKYSQTDYNFESPTTPLSVGIGDDTPFELYDYQSGEYRVRGDGETLARVRLQEAQMPAVTCSGKSDCRAFTTGYKFSLKEHYRDDLNQAYVLTSLSHSAHLGAHFRSGEDEFHYNNTFDCIPYRTPFRPSRVTARPLVYGAEVAVVVGPPAEEIYTDKYGRVKVQFPWDREGKNDEHSSCWIRVAQLWAGKKWGGMFIPRRGQEVIVEFLQGNPDQPIITGRVYNGENMPPYALPGEMTKSAIKSYSSKGGDGFNEIRFEDKKGDEQIFIHAEKNLDVRVKKDEYKTIEKDLHLVVEQDHYEHVKNKHHEKVDSDHVVEVGGDMHLKISGKQAIKVSGSHSFEVSGAVAEQFSQSHSETVSMSYLLKAKTIVLEADMGITLKCGSNSVVLNPAGVSLQGTMAVINGNMTLINSGPGFPPTPGMAGMLVSPMAVTPAKDADKADSGEMAKLKAEQVRQGKGKYGEVKLPPHRPAPPDAGGATDPDQPPKPKHWIEIALLDEEGHPVPGEPFHIVFPDGTESQGTLDEKGYARYDGIEAGTCQVTFPNLDKTIWKKA